MAKKNFYAVKVGRNVGIFKTWSECSSYVTGYPGAKFKGFETLKEASEYMAGIQEVSKSSVGAFDKFHKKVVSKKDNIKKVSIKSDEKESGLKPVRSRAKVKNSATYIDPKDLKDAFECIVFVDGSYDKRTKTFGSGVIMMSDDSKEHETFYKAGYDKWNQWNIVGELEATKLAIEKAYEMKFKNIAIYHDLKNIALWATGEWQAKNEYTQEYVKFIEEYSEKINIYFVKVKAHSTESIYNDLADEAAKNAIIKYHKNM
ncbi:MAG: viroplasmin family protein [Sarcina sp.]